MITVAPAVVADQTIEMKPAEWVAHPEWILQAHVLGETWERLEVSSHRSKQGTAFNLFTSVLVPWTSENPNHKSKQQRKGIFCRVWFPGRSSKRSDGPDKLNPGFPYSPQGLKRKGQLSTVQLCSSLPRCSTSQHPE